MTLFVSAQENQSAGVTFHVEDLSQIYQNLHPTDANEAIHKILMSYSSAEAYEARRTSKNEYEILKSSLTGNDIVSFDFNSFSKGMMNALAYHRAVILSPDMIWLLITQAFGHYINNNNEKMRPLLVSNEDNVKLEIVCDVDLIRETDKVDWNVILDDFVKQIGNNTKNNITTLLCSDFSTTGRAEKIASQITLMETVKSYFEYQVMYSVCGIPDIT